MNKKSAFTLIELIVAITILMIILVSVFVSYTQIIGINHRLELTRILQENTRIVTETIAQDIRDHGINFNYYTNPSIAESLNYTGSGNLRLGIIGWGVYWLYKETDIGNTIGCDESSTGCYLGYSPSGNTNNVARLTSSSVTIDWLRFFISWESKDAITNRKQIGKVTILFSISVDPRLLRTNEEGSSTHMDIQTTLNDTPYKN